MITKSSLLRASHAALTFCTCVFVDGIKTRADLDRYVERVVGAGLPALYNGALVPAAEAEALRFRVQILAGAALMAAFRAIRGSLSAIKETGRQSGASDGNGGAAGVPGLDSITDVLGLPAVYDLERKYAVT